MLACALSGGQPVSVDGRGQLMSDSHRRSSLPLSRRAWLPAEQGRCFRARVYTAVEACLCQQRANIVRYDSSRLYRTSITPAIQSCSSLRCCFRDTATPVPASNSESQGQADRDESAKDNTSNQMTRDLSEGDFIFVDSRTPFPWASVAAACGVLLCSTAMAVDIHRKQ